MAEHHDDTTHYSRRQVAAWLALGGAALVTACKGDGAAPSGWTGSTGDTGTSEGGTRDTGTSDSGGGTVVGWAAGGTAAMTLKASYPDPFADGTDGTCEVTCETTEGPCTADTVEREDISEGFSGLPMRLVLRVVDADCQPVEGARVLVWHTQRSGVYSGVTPSGAFCYGDDPGAEAYLYFRGNQVTDDDGVVAFDTCFPGWYSSRAPHIHFQVLLDDTLYVTGQVVCDDDLSAEVYGDHPEYSDFGLPDTTIATDTVVGGVDDPSAYILETERMDDGALLAWKTIVVRSDLADTLCAAEGAGGGGAPGGPGGP